MVRTSIQPGHAVRSHDGRHLGTITEVLIGPDGKVTGVRFAPDACVPTDESGDLGARRLRLYASPELKAGGHRPTGAPDLELANSDAG